MAIWAPLSVVTVIFHLPSFVISSRALESASAPLDVNFISNSASNPLLLLVIVLFESDILNFTEVYTLDVVALPSAFVGLASDIKEVKVNFNVEYQSKHSLNNILILTAVGQPTTYQKFLTFLNGTVSRTETLPIDVPGAESDECNPMFSLKCLPINSVSYLIEGTQSPEIFETVMDGINTVGDLVDFIDQATQILERLKNFNLNPNDILYIGSLAYNIADDLKIFVTIQTELAKLLDSDELKDNATAKRLKEALVRDVKVSTSLKVVKTNGLGCKWFNFSWCSKTIEETTTEDIVPDYSKDETKAFTDFVDLLVKTIDVNNESHQSVKDDWKQISEVSKSKQIGRASCRERV